MSKPLVTIFFAAESRPVARVIRSELRTSCRTETWESSFQDNMATLDNVSDAIRRSDFVVVIWEPLDIRRSPRDEVSVVPRDNTVFEAGWALAELGKKRTFILSPAAARRTRRAAGSARQPADLQRRSPAYCPPTNLDGIQHIKIPQRPAAHAAGRTAVRDALRKEVQRIARRIQALGSRWRKPSHEALDAIGDGPVRVFAHGLAARAADALDSFSHLAIRTKVREETLYRELAALVRSLHGNVEDILYAVCGKKNFAGDEVREYMEATVEAARRGVRVTRIYSTLDCKFQRDELRLIRGHLHEEEEMKNQMFRIGILIGKRRCETLTSLALPARFGLVLARRSGVWSAHVHYGGEHTGLQTTWRTEDAALVGYLRSVVQAAASESLTDSVRARTRAQLNRM